MKGFLLIVALNQSNANAEDSLVAFIFPVGVSWITFSGYTSPGCTGFVLLGVFVCKVGPQCHYVPKKVSVEIFFIRIK